MNARERKNRIKDMEERRTSRIRKLMENLTEFRESLGLTQSELAQLVGVTRAQIVNYETGRRVMSWMAFLAFIQVLGRDFEIRKALYRLSIWDGGGETSLIRDEDLEAVRGGVRIAVIDRSDVNDETLLRLIETELRERETSAP